jgi:hypothetical protein
VDLHVMTGSFWACPTGSGRNCWDFLYFLPVVQLQKLNFSFGLVFRINKIFL